MIVKQVKLPEQQQHPRGWNTPLSHQRKIRSYQVETHWYQHLSSGCDASCRVAQCLGTEHSEGEFVIVLEDLDASGYPGRLESAGPDQMSPCIAWLAHFHARFMGHSSEGLWPKGTYWHLDTRPDELEALDAPALKSAASKIDQRLTDCPIQTLVHGDAKLANFCFSKDGHSVAAVDFQYVGAGCGMKDLAYFIGSCLDEADCARYAKPLLDEYFAFFAQALAHYAPSNQSKLLAKHQAKEVESAWRPLFPYAWADFHRFVKGWSPGHWKIHSFSESITRSVLKELNAL